LTQGKRRRVAQRLHGSYERQPREVQHDGRCHEPTRQHQPDAQRAGLPCGHRDKGRGDHARDAPFDPVDARQRWDVVTEQQRRLHMPHVEQRHERKEDRYEQTDSETLRDGRSRQPVLDLEDRRDVPDKRRHCGNDGRGNGHAEHTARDTEQQHLRHVDRKNLA
jgi:hypothetical protein